MVINFLTIFNFTVAALSILLNLVALSLYSHFVEKSESNGYMLMTFFQFVSDSLFSIIGVVFRMELAIVIYNSKVYVSYYLVYWDGIDLSFGLYSFLVFLYFVCYYFNLTIVTSSIVARYFYVVKKFNINKWHFIGILLINATVVIGLNANFCLSGFDPNLPLDIIYQSDLLTGNKDDLVNANSRSASIETGFSYFILPYLIFFGVNFGAIFITYVKYNSFMLKFQGIMNSSTKKVNEEYLRIIRLQLIVPIFLSFAPLFTFCWFITLGVEARYWGTISLTLGAMVPSLNSVLYLVLLSKSRKILSKRMHQITAIFTKQVEITRA